MWEIDLADQITAFLQSLMTGAVSGGIFYTLEAVYKAFKIKGFLQAVFDVLFFIFAAFLSFCLLLVTTNGEPRAYIFAGELIGFWLFKVLLSKPMVRAVSFLLRTFHRVFISVLTALRLPFQKIIKKSRKILKKLAFKKKKTLEKRGVISVYLNK